MSLAPIDAKELHRQLKQVADALQQVADTLSTAISASEPSTIAPPPRAVTTAIGAETLTSPAQSSFVTGEDEDASDNDEALYVQDPLASKTQDDEHLRGHLKDYKWNGYSQEILKSLFNGSRLKSPVLFTKKPAGEDGAHYSLYQVFDVGNDGSPLPLHENSTFETVPKDQALWHLIKNVNPDSTRLRQAVGRITILREPSPIVFAAIHLTMSEFFDMDEILTHLVQQGTTTAYMKRAYDEDQRKQKSFVFSFEFFTIVGDDCKPMTWQQTDRSRARREGHVPISRCSSVVALSLTGTPIRKLKNSARRAKTQFGYVYSPWAPWHVLNIECYPDWKSNTGSHNSTKHYVNGPEAFLNTLLVEYRDAQKRFEEISQRISQLVTPPADFMFNDGLRDKLLFEDKDFTYSRRYFWAFQTLGTMNQSIKAMVDAFEETFTAAVWEGKHPTLWPLTDDSSQRNAYWLKRMVIIRKDFEFEVYRLKTLIDENEHLRKEIRDLRENLFSGTSVLESRKSVEQTEITVQQGQNIKLLTLVNMFFLPLTFVTSVFGMTNMPPEDSFWRFGVVMATVCVPFFLLIGSMNTNRGMRFWKENMHQLLIWFWGWVQFWKRRSKQRTLSRSTSTESGESNKKSPRIHFRSMSATEGILERTTQFNGNGGTGATDPGKVQAERTISFGQPIASQPPYTRTNSEKETDFRLQRQNTLELQQEMARVQAPKAVVSKEGGVMDDVDVETGTQGSQLHIWDKLKLRKAASSSKDYNV